MRVADGPKATPPRLAQPAAAALFALLSLAATARAAELVTLTNGFDVVCDHHEVVEGRVRIFLRKPGQSPAETGYLELDPQSIQGFETVPDGPGKAADAAEPNLPAQPGPGAQSPAEARLTQADLTQAALTQADLHQLLAKAGAEHNLDEDLLASVVHAESGGQARAVSRAGARGLMQLMPKTARQLGVADSFAPAENVRGGSAYLDSLLTRYHDNIAFALAAYNAGPEAVDRYRGVPPYRETRLYVARVVHEFNRRVALRRRADAHRASPAAAVLTASAAQPASNAPSGSSLANPGSARPAGASQAGRE